MKKSAAALFFLLASFNYVSAENTLGDLSLEELMNVTVVSATRSESAVISLPSMVTVLSQEELSAWGAQNLAEALRQASGLSVRKKAGDFPQYDVSIRGNLSDFLNTRTLFLIDGIPFRNSSGGLDPSWIPLTMIKRVEIVKGAVSALYGANAFGGVINVITKSGTANRGLHGSLGGRSRKDPVSERWIGGSSAEVGYGRSNGKWDYFSSATHERDNNEDETASGASFHDVFGRATFRVSEKTSFGLTGLVSYDQYQSGGGANIHAPTKNTVIHIAGSYQHQFNPTSSLQATAYLNNFRHYLDYTDQLDKYENKSETIGVTTQYSTLIQTHHAITAGLEYTNDAGSVSTKEFNYVLSQLQDAGWQRRSQDSFGLFIQEEYKGLDRFTPIFGLRYDQNSVFGGALSPRAALAYALKENLTIFGSIGTGFRAPVFNESYLLGFGKVGNENLSPELTRTIEVGVKSVTEKTQNSLSIFQQKTSRKIELRKIDPNDPNSLSTFDNVGTASILGLELEGAFNLMTKLKLFYNATFLNTDDGTGVKIDKTVEQTAVIGLNWRYGSWSLRPTLFYQANQRTYDPNASANVNLPEITTINVQAVKEWGDTNLMIYANNLTDQEYKEGYSAWIEPDALLNNGLMIGVKLSSSF